MNEEREQFYSESDVQVREKLVEPDIKNAAKINRNFQLGNITKAEQYHLGHKFGFAMTLKNYPRDKGGWVLNQIGDNIVSEVDAMLTLSLSVGAVGRRSVNSKEQRNYISEMPRSERFFDGLRRR